MAHFDSTARRLGFRPTWHLLFDTAATTNIALPASEEPAVRKVDGLEITMR